jgi:hypothetical protein
MEGCMDNESLAQIQHIVTTATETIELRLRDHIADSTHTLELRLGERIDEATRHTGVLIEDLHHKFELVVEGQQVLHRNIDNFRAELQHESQETRALLRLSYQQLQQRVENLEQRVSTIEHRLGLTV